MNYTAEYPIKPNGVRMCLRFIEQTMKDYRVGQRDLMETLLVSEETLLVLAEHAPEDAAIRVMISSHLGVPRVRLMVPGTAVEMDNYVETVSFDQMGAESENAIRSIMLRSYADSIKYRHSRSGNSLTIITGIPERILATHTVMAIVLAIITSLLFRNILQEEAVQWIIGNLFIPVESLFISALMCITAPAVFVSIACSMFRFDGFFEMGRSGKAVIINYLGASIAATMVGMACFYLFKPGVAGVLASQAGVGSIEGFSVLTILSTLIPPNIIDPFIKVNSLQLMTVAVTIGAALTMCGKRVRHLKVLLEELDILCSKVSSLVMRAVPIVVYCSVSNVFLNARMGVFVSILQLIFTILAGVAAIFVLYCLILLFSARLNPILFLRKFAPTMKNIFLKGSGIAAIPMTMRVCRRKLGIHQSICSFAIPLGATINMDGNCVCLTIISLFFARICGTPLDMNNMIILLLLVLVLSLGAPIVPGTLILCLVTLLSQMGIDTGVISLVIGINFILEMLLGMVNSVGDVVIALCVARREGMLDLNTYRKK